MLRSSILDDEKQASFRLLEQNSTGTNSTGASSEAQNNLPFSVQIILIIILIMMSGLFSGLTLGLMSLDCTGLEIVMEGDDPVAAKNARVIYPIRSNGNLLLTTLLLGNVAVNALLSILMADLTSGTVGFIVSTAVIVVFGEILPQAWCSRYALQIGSKAVPIVRVIIFLLYVLAFPLAFALDKLLGRELATVYSKSEMIKLLQIHVDKGMFDQETGIAMTGALKYKDLFVKDVMTKLENVFMLDAEQKLSFDVIAEIFKEGYSRIPVYEVSKNNIIGILFAKDLIFVDPADEISIKNMVHIFGRGAHVVWPDNTLGDVLRELKLGKSHMALVRDVNTEDENQDPFYEIKGIITLEDVIEEIIGDEIVDETDAFVDPSHNVKIDRSNFDWGRLRLLDAKITDEMLSDDEILAVTAHLRTNYKDSVALLSDRQLHKFVATTSVSEFPTAEQDFGESLPKQLLYEKGVEADNCTLILSGKVAVLAGEDNFKSEISSWSMLAAKALTEPSYVPDFTAFVSSGPCRCIVFSREKIIKAVDASAMEKIEPTRSNVSNSGLRSSTLILDKNEEDFMKSNSNIDNSIHNVQRKDRASILKVLQSKESANIFNLDNAKVNLSSINTISSRDEEKQKKKEIETKERNIANVKNDKSISVSSMQSELTRTDSEKREPPSYASMHSLRDALSDGGSLRPKKDRPDEDRRARFERQSFDSTVFLEVDAPKDESQSKLAGEK